MHRVRFVDAAGPALVATGLAAGLAWRDCMLLAIGLVLAFRLLLLRVEHQAPWSALTAAVEAATAGAATVLVGFGLVAAMGVGWLGWWQPQAPHALPLLLLLCASAGVCCMARRSRRGAAREGRCWAWLLGGVLLALEAHGGGLAPAPCLLVATIGGLMLWSGWRLAGAMATGMLHAGSDPT